MDVGLIQDFGAKIRFLKITDILKDQNIIPRFVEVRLRGVCVCVCVFSSS